MTTPDKYTLRDGMIYGLSRLGTGTDAAGLAELAKSDPSVLVDILNMAYLEGRQAATDASLTIVRDLLDKPESEIAMEGSVRKMLACGDLKLDDEPVPCASHNVIEGDLDSEGPRPRTPTSLDAMVVGLAMIDKAMKQGPRPPDATDY